MHTVNTQGTEQQEGPGFLGFLCGVHMFYLCSRWVPLPPRVQSLGGLIRDSKVTIGVDFYSDLIRPFNAFGYSTFNLCHEI